MNNETFSWKRGVGIATGTILIIFNEANKQLAQNSADTLAKTGTVAILGMSLDYLFKSPIEKTLTRIKNRNGVTGDIVTKKLSSLDS